MFFYLLHYTSKNEKKGHERCQKKHNKLTIDRKFKKFNKCMQQFLKQEIQEVATIEEVVI